MLRDARRFIVILAAVAGSLLPACSSGEGSKGVLLEGDPNSPAIEAVKDFYNGDHVSASEISEANNGARIVRTNVEIGFTEDATVGEINALLEAENGLIVSMLEGIDLVVVRVPDPGSLDGLSALIARLEANPKVSHVNRTYMPIPNELPANFSAQNPTELKYIDHDLAVRAHAAWNAKAALKDDFAEPPLLIVQDYFGDGAPNADFDVRATSGQFDRSNPDVHGYHVLGIVSAKHGGDASDRGRATGIYPGTLDVYVLDQAWLNNETSENQLIMWVKSLNRNVIVNSSLGDLCELTLAECIVPGAREWIKKLRGGELYQTGTTGPASLENKFLHFTSAGNLNAPAPTEASLNSAYNTARLMPDLDTENGAKLQNLTNTLVIESRDNSSDQPFTTVCIDPKSKYPGDLSAVGVDVWSLMGSSSGAGNLSGTSMASPQAAGLAAYIWALAPGLTPQEVMSLMMRTARNYFLCFSEVTPQPVIDAYDAVLAVDDASALTGAGPEEAPVRLAILDVVGDDKSSLGGNGVFDEVDVERFLEEVTFTPDRPDYSRFDLNGDGFTGGKTVDRFNLDIDPSITYSQVTQDIQGSPARFNESSVTDLQVLCYYSYSPLYTGDDAKRDQLWRDWIDQCKGSKLAFMRTKTDVWETDIYSMSGEGTDQVPLTSWGTQFGDSWGLSVSADGSKLAASLPILAGGYTQFDIFVMNSDGTGLTNVTGTNTSDETYPALDPEGERLAFTSWDAIYTMTLGGLPTKLPTSSNYVAYTPVHPRFSPDGKKLAFCDWKDSRGHVFVHDFDSGQTTDLGYGWLPAWSSDGTRIAFAGGDNWQELWTMSSDGSNQTKLYTLPGGYERWMTDISWAGGADIVFDVYWSSAPDPYYDDHDIYLIRPDGSGAKNITDSLGIYEQWPVWLP
jgi:subtilisin family serine protease